jgi:ABC-type microcin C transport system permease subunit YejE
VAAGAVQGYFGGWTDLLFQRFIVESGHRCQHFTYSSFWQAFITPTFWLLAVHFGYLHPGTGTCGRGAGRNSCGRAIWSMCAQARALGCSQYQIIVQ